MNPHMLSLNMPLLNLQVLNPLITQLNVQKASYQANYQTYQMLLAKANASRLLEMKNCLAQDLPMNSKINSKFGFNLNDIKEMTLFSSFSSNNKIGQTRFIGQNSPSEVLSNSSLSIKSECNANKNGAYYQNLSKELEKMVKLILANVGREDRNAIQNLRSCYMHDMILLQIFDKIMKKYYGTRKCKEDIVRYILRKSLKNIRTNLSKKEKVAGKKAATLLCKKYFYSRFAEIEKAGIDIENEDKLLEFILPYRKNSKNRTMNSNFVEEIFSCLEFRVEYQEFLNNFDYFLQDDNSKKLKKFIGFLVMCVQEENLSKIDSFNRLPWLNTWLEETKKIAIDLVPTKIKMTQEKKVKIECN